MMFPTLYNQTYPGFAKPPGFNPVPNPGMNSLPEMNTLRISDTPIIETKGTSFNWLTYVLIFFLLIFFAVIIILLFVNTSTKSKFVKPEDCPSIKSNYASIPSIPLGNLSTITSCSGNPDGYQGNQPCSFSNIANLYDAQNLCNKYQNSICSGFYYNPTNQQVNFIKTGFTLTSSTPVNTSVDVYLKQTN